MVHQASNKYTVSLLRFAEGQLLSVAGQLLSVTYCWSYIESSLPQEDGAVLLGLGEP